MYQNSLFETILESNLPIPGVILQPWSKKPPYIFYFETVIKIWPKSTDLPHVEHLRGVVCLFWNLGLEFKPVLIYLGVIVPSCDSSSQNSLFVGFYFSWLVLSKPEIKDRRCEVLLTNRYFHLFLWNLLKGCFLRGTKF